MPNEPRIALIHATPVAINPVLASFASDWPQARPFNLLEDSLSVDRAEAGTLTPEISERILELGRYARRIGSDGILFTCSAFGPAIERAADLLDIPVLKPNEAMFEEAVARGGRAAMIYTFAASRESMEAEFAEEAGKAGSKASLVSFLAPGAMDSLRKGDEAAHNRAVADVAYGLEGFDSIVLAHFSTSRAARAVRERSTIPVLTSPGAAVAKLRRLIADR